MKFNRKNLLTILFILFGYLSTVSAMEIIFGRKYPINQKVKTDQLSWTSVKFEKDLTGKVIYKLEASHPNGKKISYLKGKDYLVSEEIQKNMVRSFEVKIPEVEFDSENKVTFEVVLPYDFKTRYLPLKFEKADGYQEIVLRLRFGDYRFMLASRLLNSVSYIENNPSVASAKKVDGLFLKRSQLKKREVKLVEKEKVANVNVDDIYDAFKKDIKTQIGSESEIAKSNAAGFKVPDEVDALLDKYLPTEEEAKSVVNPTQGYAINPNDLNGSGKSLNVKGEVSYEDSRADSSFSTNSAQQDIINNPTTDADYQAYVDDLIKKEKSTEFDPEASIDEIIAQAGGAQVDGEYGAAKTEANNEDESEASKGQINIAENATDESGANIDERPRPKKRKKVYIEPVDTNELFGLPSDNWAEPKAAPVLVMKPKAQSKNRKTASFAPPQRNNFVEWAPPAKAKPKKSVDMDSLFGEQPGADQNVFGF